MSSIVCYFLLLSIIVTQTFCKECPPLTSEDVRKVCKYTHGGIVSCEYPIRPGTKANITCKSYSEYSASTPHSSRREITCLENGTWDLSSIVIVPDVTSYDLLDAATGSIKDLRFDIGLDGYPAYVLKPGSDIKKPYRLHLPEKLPAEFTLVATFKSLSSNPSYLFAVLNPFDTVVQLGLRISDGPGSYQNMTLLYTNSDLHTLSDEVATFTVNRLVKKWAEIVLEVTTTEVTLYLNCHEFGKQQVVRIPTELVFDTASKLYLGQAGPNIQGYFNGSIQTLKLYPGSSQDLVTCKNDTHPLDDDYGASGSESSDSHQYGLFESVPEEEQDYNETETETRPPPIILPPPAVNGETKITGPKGPKGDPGKDGPRGPPGYRGMPGYPGLPGIPGEKGSKGDSGPEGKMGATGPPGYRGMPGLFGIPGEKGSKGGSGPEGKMGATGPPGFDGRPGLPGIPGEEGSKGDSGPEGKMGATGPPGYRGMPGLFGIPGEKGSKGGSGPEGKMGATGPPGFDGRPGLPGIPGEKGSKGDSGPEGKMGATGPPGYRGMPGLFGIPGEKGSKGGSGPEGKMGATGPPGFDGRPGLPGIPGEEGSKGDSGPEGKMGATGPPGFDGRPGLPGIPGEEGSKGDSGPEGKMGATGPPGPPGQKSEDPRQKGDKGDPGPPGLDGDIGWRGQKGDTGPRGENGSHGQKGEPGCSGLDERKGERGESGPPGLPTVPRVVMFQNTDAMTKMSAASQIGTLAYIIDEDAFLFRVKNGWQYITLGYVLPVATPSSGTTAPASADYIVGYIEAS